MLNEIFNMEKILGACERFLYFLKINFFFLLSNLPVLLFFLFVGIRQVRTYLPLFLLCLLWAGPALCALFFSMNRVLHRMDTTAFRDYKTGYLDSWGKKMGITAIHLLLIWVFWNNVEFFSLQIPILPLTLLFALLFGAAVIVTPNLYLLASRYEMKVKDLFRGAFTLCITRPVLTLGNTAVLAVVLMLLEIQAGTFILFIASIYGFIVVFMNQRVLRAIEESH